MARSAIFQRHRGARDVALIKDALRDKDAEIARLQSTLAKHVDRVCESTSERDALQARIDGAVKVKVRGKVGELATIVVSHDLVGQRIALVVLEAGK